MCPRGKKKDRLEDPKTPENEEPKKESKGGWIKMSFEEMKEHQKNGVLVGYNPSNGVGLIA